MVPYVYIYTVYSIEIGMRFQKSLDTKKGKINYNISKKPSE